MTAMNCVLNGWCAEPLIYLVLTGLVLTGLSLIGLVLMFRKPNNFYQCKAIGMYKKTFFK